MNSSSARNVPRNECNTSRLNEHHTNPNIIPINLRHNNDNWVHSDNESPNKQLGSSFTNSNYILTIGLNDLSANDNANPYRGTVPATPATQKRPVNSSGSPSEFEPLTKVKRNTKNQKKIDPPPANCEDWNCKIIWPNV